jgi:hypothetical protein
VAERISAMHIPVIIDIITVIIHLFGGH